MNENIKIAYIGGVIGAVSACVGSILIYVSNQQTISSQKEIAKIQVDSQKTIEENKLIFEREKFFTEYIIKNAKKFTSNQQREMINVIRANNINHPTMSLALFIVQSNPNIRERERIYKIAENSINKNLGNSVHSGGNDKIEKLSGSAGKMQGVQNDNQNAIEHVLNDIVNAYGSDAILPNKCFSPQSAYSVRLTFMYSDAEMTHELKQLLPNTKVIPSESNEHSFKGKFDGKEGYFRIADFKRAMF